MQLELPQNVVEIIAVFKQNGFEAYAVGGAIRSLLLNLPVKDWDIVTTALPSDTAHLFERTFLTGEAYGTVTVLLNGETYEVTSARTEAAYTDARHPEEVRFGASIKEDLARRDFTMNAIAYNGKTLLDPYKGVTAIQKKMVQCVGTPQKRFEEDALRILRAFRFAATLGFTIEKKTLQAALQCATNLQYISKERVRIELQKTLLSANPALLEELVQTGGLTAFQIPNNATKYSFSALNDVPAKTLLRWWAFARVTGANFTALCECLQFSKLFLKDMIFIDRAFLSAKPKTVKQMKRYLRNGLPVAEKNLFKAFSALDESYAPCLVLFAELEKSNDPYRMNMLAISGGDLYAHGLKGKNIRKTMELLLDTVIENPELNKHSVLLEIAKGIYTLL